MQTNVYRDGRLPKSIGTALAQYRYQIFVKKLGWRLPTTDDLFERDQYDRADTVHVIATDEAGSICGCARLLPTTQSYLLKELFPFLLPEEMSTLESPNVWELSRFAATPINTGHSEEGNGAWGVRPMLAAAVQCAAQLGARRLIGVTFLSMQRLFGRIGVRAHRAGPTECMDGRSVVACWIDVDSQTLAALGIDVAKNTPSVPIGPNKKEADQGVGLPRCSE